LKTFTQLSVVRDTVVSLQPDAGETRIGADDFRNWIRTGRIARHLARYDSARLLIERLGTAGRPLLTASALRLTTRGRCYIQDLSGRRRDVTAGLLVQWAAATARERFLKARFLREAEARVDDTIRREEARVSTPAVFDRSAAVLYLRTDLSFGVPAGGSVGHVAGVVNELAHLLGKPIVVTAASVPTLSPDIEVHYVPAPEAFWNYAELPAIVLDEAFDQEAVSAVGRRSVSLLYQRYSLDSYAGLRLARRFRVPFVLEYNGSEVWMHRHWGRPLKYPALADRIELLNVKAADLVVVVSDAMRDELVSRGIGGEKVLVNPNAVDADRYRPDLDGSGIRASYGWDRHTVIGFISTFQPWHGAEVLADAFVRLIRDRPGCRESVRLLMIGSGPGLATAKRIIASAQLSELTAFAGLVPQEEGARYLAACDILASPHVPNPDGSPFFGSPTKLFEYMAMGRGIVASDLDQLGQLLRHGDTAWLVKPADAGALEAGLAQLIEDPALCRALGERARRDVLARHTWRAHVQRTLDALERQCSARTA
jgi:glycosyltransferase involved in cell wall biosynthesis